MTKYNIEDFKKWLKLERNLEHKNLILNKLKKFFLIKDNDFFNSVIGKIESNEFVFKNALILWKVEVDNQEREREREQKEQTNMDTGWLTDENIEFILKNKEINDKRVKNNYIEANEVRVYTDIANIYHAFQTSKSDGDTNKFKKEHKLVKNYNIFPLRVSGNHWGVFIIETGLFQVAYYTSSGSGVESELEQVKPLIKKLTNTTITNSTEILKGQKQTDAHNCGVFLIFYIWDILETQKLDLNKKYTDQDINNFRQEWKTKIGEERWCKIDTLGEEDVIGDVKEWQKLGITNIKEWFDETKPKGEKGFTVLDVKRLIEEGGFLPNEGQFAHWLKKQFKDQGKHIEEVEHLLNELATATSLEQDINYWREQYKNPKKPEETKKEEEKKEPKYIKEFKEWLKNNREQRNIKCDCEFSNCPVKNNVLKSSFINKILRKNTWQELLQDDKLRTKEAEKTKKNAKSHDLWGIIKLFETWKKETKEDTIYDKALALLKDWQNKTIDPVKKELTWIIKRAEQFQNQEVSDDKDNVTEFYQRLLALFNKFPEWKGTYLEEWLKTLKEDYEIEEEEDEEIIPDWLFPDKEKKPPKEPKPPNPPKPPKPPQKPNECKICQKNTFYSRAEFIKAHGISKQGEPSIWVYTKKQIMKKPLVYSYNWLCKVCKQEYHTPKCKYYSPPKPIIPPPEIFDWESYWKWWFGVMTLDWDSKRFFGKY